MYNYVHLMQYRCVLGYGSITDRIVEPPMYGSLKTKNLASLTIYNIYSTAFRFVNFTTNSFIPNMKILKGL